MEKTKAISKTSNDTVQNKENKSQDKITTNRTLSAFTRYLLNNTNYAEVLKTKEKIKT